MDLINVKIYVVINFWWYRLWKACSVCNKLSPSKLFNMNMRRVFGREIIRFPPLPHRPLPHHQSPPSSSWISIKTDTN